MLNTTILSFQVPSVHILGNDNAPFNSERFNHALTDLLNQTLYRNAGMLLML
jgi:hypothetical protein